MSEIPTMVLVEKIMINPNNPRFYEFEEAPGQKEIDAINTMINLSNSKIIQLCEDISINGIMPNQSIIVSPMENDPDTFLAYDGNRRLTCIKLMTIYKNRLSEFNLSVSDKKKIKNFTCDINSISCIISTDKKRINQLLFRQHAAPSGIGQLNWNSQVKAKFLADTDGPVSKALAIARMIIGSEKITIPTEILTQISTSGWHTKVDRLLSKKEYGYLLGIEFIDKNEIKCFFDKKTQEEIILNFFQKVQSVTASEYIQKADGRRKFYEEFIAQYKINDLPLINISYIFSPYSSEYLHPKYPTPKELIKNTLSRYTNPVILDSTTTSVPISTTTVLNATKSTILNDSIQSQDNHNGNNTVQIAPFLENLRITKVDNKKIENTPLLLICEEINNFSKANRGAAPYKKYPIAATLLLRSLIEQCFKYLLRETHSQLYKNVQNKSHEDPSLGTLITTINKNRESFFTSKTILRHYNALFTGQFQGSSQDFLNLASHHARSNATQLEDMAKNFLPIADYILNTKLENKEV